jgi:hypothetical protein
MNRSTSAFNTAVDALAAGRQPDLPGGYLLRNNGFWGNGRHGTAIYPSFTPEHPLSHPYSGEMMTLYMWRHFGNDLAEHAARVVNPAAARLSPVLKRHLGMGNASGLGMVPFVIAHPKRIHAWVVMRELAIAHALGEGVTPNGPEVGRLIELVERCIAYFSLHDRTGKDMYAPSSIVRDDLAKAGNALRTFRETGAMLGAESVRPWQTLVSWARRELHRESVEVLHSLLIELYPDRAFEIAKLSSAPGDYRSDVDPAMTLGALTGLIRHNYAWALGLDVTSAQARHHFWYYSEENVEPRLGERGVDPGDDREAFVDVPGAVQTLLAKLGTLPAERTVAEFLLGHPEHRSIPGRTSLWRDPWPCQPPRFSGLPPHPFRAFAPWHGRLRPPLKPLGARHFPSGRADCRGPCRRYRRRLDLSAGT